MRKLISLLLAVLLLLSCGSAACAIGFDGGDDADFGLVEGYVRTKETFKAPGESSTTTRTFNKQGKLLKEKEVYQSEGYTSATTKTLAYDKNGYLLKETDVTKSASGVEKAVYLYTNDKKGNPIREEVQMGESSHTFERTYDKKGNLTKEVNYFNNGIDTAVWVYDGKGNVKKHVSRTDYENNTWNKSTVTYSYDKKGNETKEKFVFSSSDGSSEKQTITHAYNAEGQMIKTTDVYAFNNHVDFATTTKKVTVVTYGSNGKPATETEKSVTDNGPDLRQKGPRHRADGRGAFGRRQQQEHHDLRL